jgi:hypothetical protein
LDKNIFKRKKIFFFTSVKNILSNGKKHDKVIFAGIQKSNIYSIRMLLLRSHPVLTRKGIGIKRGLRGIFGSGGRGTMLLKKKRSILEAVYLEA